MSIAKNIEISSLSKTSFDDAIESGIKKAGESLENIRGAWIKEKKVKCENGKITGYEVIMKITFVVS